MAATNTKKAIKAIRAELDALEQAISAPNGGVPVDAPLTFGRVAQTAAHGAASSVQEFGEA